LAAAAVEPVAVAEAATPPARTGRGGTVCGVSFWKRSWLPRRQLQSDVTAAGGPVRGGGGSDFSLRYRLAHRRRRRGPPARARAVAVSASPAGTIRGASGCGVGRRWRLQAATLVAAVAASALAGLSGAGSSGDV